MSSSSETALSLEVDEAVCVEVFASAPFGIFVLDAAFRVLYRNPEADRLSGSARDLSAFAGCDLAAAADRALRGVEAEWETWSANGKRCFSFRIRPGGNGTFHLWCHDVTARKKSDEEHRLLALDAARIAAWNRDVATGAVSFSPRYRSIYGLAADQQHNYNELLRTIHPQDTERILAALNRAIHDHLDYDEEYRIRWADGTERWVAAWARASYDAQNRPVMLHGVSMDITDRKSTEEALRRTTNALRTVIDACPVAIMTVDARGKVAMWNRAAQQIFGWAEPEVLGEYAPCVPQDCAHEHMEILTRILAGEVVSTMQRTARAKSGRAVELSFSAAPLRGSESPAYGAVFVMQDITEARNLERRMQHSQKLESLGVLAGGVAHDFNNLLTGILGNASLAIDLMPEEDRNRPMLNEIVRASERAADLTRQLLAYAGKGRFVTRLLDLSAQVDEIGMLVSSSIPKKVHLMRDLPGDLPLVEGDPSQMQQIIMNLVINAAESIGADRPGTVLVSTRAVEVEHDFARGFLHTGELSPGAYVVLEVHDTGCGMDDETRARMFDPFFSTKFTGRGLGLSAVLGIVHGHKGALRVTSREGEGTSFTILFPAAGPRKQQLEPTGTKRVLALTDVTFDVPQLRGAGFELTNESAASGVAGILVSVENRDEFASVQRQYPGVPIIAVTAHHQVDAMRTLPGCGVAGFLRKPWTTAELIQKLHTVLRGVHNKKGPDESGPVE